MSTQETRNFIDYRGEDYFKMDWDFQDADSCVHFIYITKSMLLEKYTDKLKETNEIFKCATQLQIEIYQAILAQDRENFLRGISLYCELHTKIMEKVDDNISDFNDVEYLNVCNGLMDTHNEYKKLAEELVEKGYFTIQYSNPTNGTKLTPYEFVSKYTTAEVI